jgi:Protein of unknown function (DUF1566)
MIRGWGALLLAGVAAIAVVLAASRKGSSAAPPGRYTIPGDGTVYDTQTKLTWQQATLPVQTQSVAIASCPSVGLPGTGWRLPTIKELHTLIDFSASAPPYIDQTAFPDTPTADGNSGYWSSSAQAGNPVGSVAMGWTVYFSIPATMFNETFVGAYIRCVR